MKYEMVNIFASYIEAGDIVVYTYSFKGQEYKALITKEAKDQAISLGLIDNRNIIIDFDSEDWVKETYNKYVYKGS